MTQVLAHRGSAGPARENTLDAFSEALRLGADGCELDVRATSDGYLVVHHDATIDGLAPISELQMAELPGYVPTLEDSLARCGAKAVNVEIKHAPGEPGFDPSERLARRVAEVISETSTGGEFVVSSFSLETIDAVLGVNGALETAWLIEPGADVGDAIGTAAYHGHLGVHPYHLFVDEAVVFAAHDLGLAVRAWTVDDGDRISRLGALGVDALITNDVSTALRALGRSGPDSS